MSASCSELPSRLAVGILPEAERTCRLHREHPRLTVFAGVAEGVRAHVEAPLLAVLRDPGLGQRADPLLAGDSHGPALDDDVRATVERIASRGENHGGIVGDVARLALLGTGAEVDRALTHNGD